MPLLDLHIERPVAGGRMLARHEGVVVLVAGAIPGERVRARVERSTRNLMWAETVEVLEASASRRTAFADPSCGGMDYAHITYTDQLQFKGQVIVDAFRRIGKMSIDASVPVAPSPEQGYRLRARLHVQGRRAGFVREGTHVLCDAAATMQLLPETMAAIDATLGCLGGTADEIGAVIVAENVAATERVLHLDARDESNGDEGSGPARPRGRRGAAALLEAIILALAPALAELSVKGITTAARGRISLVAGTGQVTDTAADIFGAASPVSADTRWTRQATSFFQGNRFVTGPLVRHVLDVATGTRIADLYAGVGLFAVALAARGTEVVAVEGDVASGADLERNAEPWSGRLEVVRASVEDTVSRLSDFETVVLDPPRTGVSPPALASIIQLGSPRLVYVSCDPATLARDAAKIVGAGYRVESVRAFDLFPNTAHVETVVAFGRSV